MGPSRTAPSKPPPRRPYERGREPERARSRQWRWVPPGYRSPSPDPCFKFDAEDRQSALDELRGHIHGKAVPTVCFCILVGLCNTFREPRGFPSKDPQMEQRRLSDPIANEFWELGFEWICMRRTVKELQDIHVAWRKCRCTPAQKASTRHLKGTSIIPGVVDQDEGMPWIFHKLLEPLADTQSHDRMINSSRQRRMSNLHQNPSVWPRTRKSILPFGPEETVKGFLSWLQIRLSPASRMLVYNAISGFVAHYHPVVTLHIISSDVFLQHGILRYIEEQLPDTTNEKWKNVDVMDIYASLAAIIQMIDLVTRHTCSLSQRRAFLTHHSKALMIAYSQGTQICDEIKIMADGHERKQRLDPDYDNEFVPSRQVDALRSRFIYVGAQLVKALPNAYQHPPKGVSSTVFEEILSRYRFEREDRYMRWQWLLDTLYHVEISQRCWAPGCGRTFMDTPLRCCTGCKLISYCSRRCQKVGWQGKLSHKKVCFVIRTVCNACQIPRRGFMKIPGVHRRRHTQYPFHLDGEYLQQYLTELTEYDETLRSIKH